jgi:hypothetical protein
MKVLLANVPSSQSTHSGIFTVTGISKNGYPVYQNDRQQYLYYWTDYLDWTVSADYNSRFAGITSVNNKGGCPDTFSVWKYFNGTSFTSSSITASCEANTTTTNTTTTIQQIATAVSTSPDTTFRIMNGTLLMSLARSSDRMVLIGIPVVMMLFHIVLMPEA